MTTNEERTKWIDVAKAIAIMAVMTDHMYYTLYSSQSIVYATYFSVSLFILVMGLLYTRPCKAERKQ